VSGVRIGCIVEGHGDSEAVPVLIRRIAEAFDPALYVHVPSPIRIPKSRLVRPGELERAVELAALKIPGQGGILVLLDSDDDCPAHRGPELLQRAFSARPDLLIGVVLAKREFEGWFLAAAESLRGQRGLAQDITPPPDPENVRGAKEWLSDRMPGKRSYSETLDQAALTARFDLTTARRADSFDKCYRQIVRVLQALRGTGSGGR
jgi:hypothetical protein